MHSLLEKESDPLPTRAATGAPFLPEIAGFRTENRKYQTRFHFRMDKCIGCHCCEVACAEQNGLPADTQWRRVGEVEGGKFPDVKRYYLSSGCNHCLDAPCMKGCPVDAYQVNDRGIVLHMDNVCIGCQYCTWNCPYGVPVYQEDRKIVTKCDMCTNRLDQNLDPACVEACPSNAILIESVPVEDVFAAYKTEGAGPDMPPPQISIPSTKITLPVGMDMAQFQKVDQPYVRPEHPHTPLIWMTVLTQLATGSFLFTFLFDLMRYAGFSGADAPAMSWLSPAVAAIALLSLGASTLHLGRPLFAYRAWKMWRTSWLSREVIALSLFAFIAIAYAGFTYLTDGRAITAQNKTIVDQIRLALGSLTLLSGIVGVYSSSMLYRVPSRPGWNSRKTTIDFFMVALIAGPALFAFAAVISSQIFDAPSETLITLLFSAMRTATIAASVFNLMQAAFMRDRENSPVFELRASSELYLRHFWRLRVIRNVFLVGGLFGWFIFETHQVSFLSTPGAVISALHLFCLTVVSLVNRYLFFVTVVPRNIPGNYLMAAHAVGREKAA